MMNYGVRSQCVDLGGVLKSNVKERLRCSKVSLWTHLGICVCAFACFLVCLMLNLIGEVPKTYMRMFRGSTSG